MNTRLAPKGWLLMLSSLLLISGLGWAGGYLAATTQIPPAPFPPTDFAYVCTPSIPTAPPLAIKYTALPGANLQIALGGTPSTTDTSKPTIASVIYSGGSSVLTNSVAIPATTNGVPFTVSAGDNVGVTIAKLYVDGKQGPQEGDGVTPLPSIFYLRWNASPVAPGVHQFKLVVWDAARNSDEKSWSMTR